MRRIPIPVCGIVLIWSFGQPAVAQADPITVAGSLVVSRTLGVLEISGAEGFTLNASGSRSGGLFRPVETCEGIPTACAPGGPLDIEAFWSGSDLTGEATYRGDAFTVDIGTDVSGSALAHFTGSGLVPDFEGEELVSFFAPFNFMGNLSTPFGEGMGGTTVGLVGQGTARIDLRWVTISGGGWLFESALYEFEAVEPVPEPATLLLVGSGLVAGVVRRRRSRRLTVPRA